jgi:hypothetical protein
MKLPPEVRGYLNEVAEQLKMDADVIEMHIELVIKKNQPHQVRFFESLKEACEGKWRRALEFLD